MSHDQINAELKAFNDNPAAFMSRRPAKEEVPPGASGCGTAPVFDQAALERHDYVAARDLLRSQAAASGELDERARALFIDNDRADKIVDVYGQTSLRGMEDSGLMSARLPEQPWSDDYWGLYLGVLGKRYADGNFPKSTDWKVNFDYIQRSPAAAVLAGGNMNAVNRLSPSEKYDILVGDPQFSLTKQMWEEGRRYYEGSGQVELWMGICHGWAAAAYMLPRPVNAVTVLAADGQTRLTFYPSDIKALASLLWAKVSPKVRFIGGRCNDKNPQTDPQTGRILAQHCFDTNPGTWHLAMVNQIGVSQRSMVMDATYDYEVWNQPVLAYSCSYFNPASGAAVNSLAAATVRRAQFSNDKFAAWRGKDADSIVGIAMEVEYLVETAPSQFALDGPHRDRVTKVRYLYDLELDFSGKIIGGEWYQNAHPDFLWTPAKGARALPPWEARNTVRPEDWQEGRPVPEMWRQIAAITSEYSRTPMAAVTERLIQLSGR